MLYISIRRQRQRCIRDRNVNLNLNNILNNKDVVTYAYQQGRLDTKNYDRNAYPNRFSYAQGFRMYLNIGIRF